ncbi:hypothetical protein ACFFLM_09005 [Deinococcus oregonensis]|uniref:Thioredoxin domain-containing protein n=1 Tax=Deinococcus oregonensis TaxID=1805970 RepID=A0ABV6AZN5_9DEIO
MTTGTVRSKSKANISLLIGGLIITLAGAGAVGWWFFQPKAPEGVVPDDQQSVDRIVNRLVADFDRSRTFKLLKSGQYFPPLNLKVLSGSQKPDWSKPMLITFGTEYAPTLKEFYKTMTHNKIQRIHVIYNQEPITSDGVPSADINAKAVAEFPSDVILLDASSPQLKEPLKIRAELEKLGIQNAGYAFLRDAKGNILYVNNTIGLDATALTTPLQKFISKSPNLNKVLESPNIGESLPLNVLPASISKRTMSELNKTRTVVFFSSNDCDVCEPWSKLSVDYVKKWHSQGYGVLFVKNGSADWSLSPQTDGSLTLTDIVHFKARSGFVRAGRQ